MKTDGQLQHDVMDELEWDPSVDHADIGVAVNDGVVTLSGYVSNYLEKMAAEKATRRVSGVKAIAEEIQVRFKSEPKTADHEIAKRILDMFSWNVSIPHEKINVRVEKGWVTLSGVVDAYYQSDEARRAAAGVSGVTGVSNLVEVKKLPVSADIRERIAAAFKRCWNASPKVSPPPTPSTLPVMCPCPKAGKSFRCAKAACLGQPRVA